MAPSIPVVSQQLWSSCWGQLPGQNRLMGRHKQLPLVADFPSLPQLGSRDGQPLAEAARLVGAAPATPEDPPALAAHMLRERQLHVGGPVPRADLQELRGEEGWVTGLGVAWGFQYSLQPPLA